MAQLKEKVGYGLGDMASSMFWKIFSYYLPIFYSTVFGLRLTDAGVLVLVTRVWDAVSDPMMGVIADRTQSRWGKYRPWLLWMALPFSLCGVLLFTTPDWQYASKLVWAYVTYLLMMTVYTGINVPYGAMLGVVTDNPRAKTVFSSFRMFFAYAGSFLSLALWEPLCHFFSGQMQLSQEASWQSAMVVVATLCLLMFLGCFGLTREHVRTQSTVSVTSDFRSMLHNRPWFLLLGAALCFNLFCTVRGATVAFFFRDVIPVGATLPLLGLAFFAGLFLSVGEVANMVGVAVAVPLSGRLGKKSTFLLVNALLIGLSILFYFMPVTPVGFLLMLVLQVLISILTGIMSPLVWSMYADVSDYAELRYHTASTGLIFSSSSMAQKFGGAIGGAAVLWLLAACGYITDDTQLAQGAVQPDSALHCLWLLMTFIPALVSLLAIAVVSLYPLTTQRVEEINQQLRTLRNRQTER